MLDERLQVAGRGLRCALDAVGDRGACGTGPQTTVSWHMGLSSGRTASTASASPASIATSCPASAGLREPETGAST